MNNPIIPEVGKLEPKLFMKCDLCSGEGEITTEYWDNTFQVLAGDTETCEECDGTGFLPAPVQPLPSSLTEEDRKDIAFLLNHFLPRKKYPSTTITDTVESAIRNVCSLAQRSTVWNAAKEYESAKTFVETFCKNILSGELQVTKETPNTDILYFLTHELASMKPSLSQDALPTNTETKP